MSFQLDQKHEDAIRWGFEKQNADWIASVLKDESGRKSLSDSTGNIYSLYMTYRDEIASSLPKLSNLLSDYNRAKDKDMASKLVRAANMAGIDYVKLQPNCLKRDARG